MKQSERISRYVEILAEHDLGNTSWNWEILDELTDEELFDENKIKKKINIILEHITRIENNPNKYPEYVMECVRRRWGLKRYDDLRDEEINKLSSNEVFKHVCEWNGLIEYAYIIKKWIEDIYKVDLNKR